MNLTIEHIFILVGTLYVILSGRKVVCDVDPSDTASILLEQLKVQTKQLLLNEQIIKQQQEQLRNQVDQIALLDKLNHQTGSPIYVTLLLSVACTAFGYAAIKLMKRLFEYLQTRYAVSPEMPQTQELTDFAHTNQQFRQLDIEHLRSVREEMKSPASIYHSGESLNNEE